MNLDSKSVAVRLTSVSRHFGAVKALDSISLDVYDGARHGYTMADQPVFDEAARERHYAELGALLERTLPQR